MQGKVSTQIESKPGCVACAVDIMGNKWTPLLIMQLADGPARFSHLEKGLAGISPRTLSQRLQELEDCGILHRTSYNTMPPRVDYELTDKGKDLLPILKSMASWGAKYAAKKPATS